MVGGPHPLVLFCGDPLGWSRGGAVDSAYETEAAAAAGAGFEIALLDFEALVDLRDAARATRGVRLFTDPAAYRHCHYLPEWYSLLEGHTPRSVWLPLDPSERAPGRLPLERVMEAVRGF